MRDRAKLRTPGRRIGLALAIGLAVQLYPRDALAYIDMSAGSIVLQAGIASFLGIVYTVKLYWGELKARLRGAPPEVGPEADDAPSADDEPS